MKNSTSQPPCNEETRFEQLELLIENLFGHLGLDEAESLAREFDESTTRMIEVIDVRPRSSLVMDLMEDLEFKPVLFPKELLALLRRQDAFLATMGFKNGFWTVLYLSPPYVSEKFYEDDCEVDF